MSPPLQPIRSTATLVDVIHERALREPARLAYTFLVDGESEETTLTYGQLDRRARAIAARLERLGLTGERALLLYPPGLDYVTALFGCLYAGVVAIPALPPRPNRGMARVRAIAMDAEPAVALTTTTVLRLQERQPVASAELQKLRWLATDRIFEAEATEWRAPGENRDGLAFIQYTSGSTASPRGVMLSHANLMHNAALAERLFEYTPGGCVVSWLPPYHDMGLIGGILHCSYAEVHSILMSPAFFMQRPFRWLQAISQFGATVSGGPDSAYAECVRRVTDMERDVLDLHNWEIAFCGAEPVRYDTMTRFTERFAPCGFRREAFYPCYGLAEATLIVSGGRKTDPPVHKRVSSTALQRNQFIQASPAEAEQILVSSGRIPAEEVVEIVDPESLTRCPPGRVGEIWVSSGSVGLGYWNRPAESRPTFQAALNESDNGSTFLRTGDLGCIDEGELYVTGRLKDLIIIRGTNHYSQDIELTMEWSHPAVAAGGAAAFSVEIGGEERLVVAAEIARDYKVEHYSNGDPAWRVPSKRSSRAFERRSRGGMSWILTPSCCSGKVHSRGPRAANSDGTPARRHT